jgi:hypothetical protein
MPEKWEQWTLLDETMLADPNKWHRVYKKLPEGERYGWVTEILDRTPEIVTVLSFQSLRGHAIGSDIDR